ncbi:MAG: hypothetical protein OK474_08580 [Thaumarchaeota archaeon]|nr:hypothetical protein [Nitrososphaerota archaeon]
MDDEIVPAEDGSLSRSSRNRNLVSQAVLISAPLIVFASIIFWFSRNPISPNPTVEGSAANPIGLITSNFVYDGWTNIENIVLSSVFLLIVCLYYPRKLRIFMVYPLPFLAVASGGLAMLTAISSPYARLAFCATSCSFYGMSGIASAMVGFTFAGFFISFGLIIIQERKGGGPAIKQSVMLRGRTGLRSQAILASAFVAYVLLLLLFAGVIALPGPSPGNQPQGNSSQGTTTPPPPIFTQTPPTLLVHSASLTYGFLLCLATFFLVNRRYHIFVSP